MSSELSVKTVEKLSKTYDKKSKSLKVSEHSVKKNGVFNASYDDSTLACVTDIYSNEVKDIGKITNQKQSGRCWLYAGLNVLRKIIAKNLKVADIELSESYLFFYDKLEKANHFLNLVLETLDEEEGSRKLDYIFMGETPSNDGGFWHFVVNLVEKYGVCPIEANKETASCANSTEMDEVLDNLMCKFASALRNDYKAGVSKEELEARKEEYLQEVYNVLVVCLGKPVSSFVYEYEEKDDDKDEKKDGEESSEESESKEEKKDKNKFRRIETTPKKFFEDYCKADLEELVVIVNYPTDKLPYNKLYEYEFCNNVDGAHTGRFVNVDLDTFKKAAIDQIKDDTPIWFACDVSAFANRKEGYLVKDMFDIESTFNIDFTVPKGERVLYHISSPNHAMTLTGVNLVNDKPNRWKVMNSWGEDFGLKGYFLMDDAWFDEYTYELVINKKYLPKEIVEVFEKGEPEILPYYAPFGKICD